MCFHDLNAGVLSSSQQFAFRDVMRSTASARNLESASMFISMFTSLADEITFSIDFLIGQFVYFVHQVQSGL